MISRRSILALAVAASLAGGPAAARDLPSWNPGAARRAIETFVAAVTAPGPDFVRPEDRIAVFDNDGTLWSEQPLYTEFAFSLAQAAKRGSPAPAAPTDADLLKLVVATHAGMTTDEFSAAARDWLSTAKNPRSGRLYRDSGYPPMRELMDYLRTHGFKVFIVSGGDVDFMRVFAEAAYGVPPDQVIGSSSETRFEARGDGFALVRQPKMVVDDKATKPSNIALHIGRKPIFAAGNSDGDLEMLQYATSGPGRRLGMIVHHDDAAREYAYDRASKVGTLDKALDEAGPRAWTVISMQRDWAAVFPPGR